MTTVLLVGAGAVAVRAGRQLVDTPGLERLLVTARHAGRAGELADALGGTAVPYGTLPAESTQRRSPSRGRRRCHSLAGRSPRDCRSRPSATTPTGSPDCSRWIPPHTTTRFPSSLVAPSPLGSSDVLARHAADSLEAADEVHVARVGAAGEACTATLRRSRRERPVEWGDGRARVSRRLGPELVWFPDPIGARECVTVAGGVETIHQAVPTVTRATVRAADSPPPRRRFLNAQRRDGGRLGRGARRGLGLARHRPRGRRLRRDRAAGRRRGHGPRRSRSHVGGAASRSPAACTGAGGTRSRCPGRAGPLPRRARPPGCQSGGVRGCRRAVSLRATPSRSPTERRRYARSARGAVAQLAERRLCKPKVAGSTPVRSTRWRRPRPSSRSRRRAAADAHRRGASSMNQPVLGCATRRPVHPRQRSPSSLPRPSRGRSSPPRPVGSQPDVREAGPARQPHGAAAIHSAGSNGSASPSPAATRPLPRSSTGEPRQGEPGTGDDGRRPARRRPRGRRTRGSTRPCSLGLRNRHPFPSPVVKRPATVGPVGPRVPGRSELPDRNAGCEAARPGRERDDVAVARRLRGTRLVAQAVGLGLAAAALVAAVLVAAAAADPVVASPPGANPVTNGGWIAFTLSGTTSGSTVTLTPQTGTPPVTPS